MLGTDVPFASMFGWRAREDASSPPRDVAARRPVVVLGRTARDQIFGAGASVVGQTVTIHGVSLHGRRRDRHRRSRSDGDGVRAVHGAAGRARHLLPAHDHDRSRAGGRGVADRRGRHHAAARSRHATHINAAVQTSAAGRRRPATRCRRAALGGVARRLHREDAVAGSADQGALHVGGRVHPARTCRSSTR